MIDQATIDRILDAAQIYDVVSDFVTLRKRGVNYVGLCPFHDDKTPSFYVSPAKGLCKCFACGKGGNAVHFIMEHDQLRYPDALVNIPTGGRLLGSIVMAPDDLTAPLATKGMVVYGIGIGVITVLIRYFGAYPEGVSFAILIMNSIVPLLNKYIKPARFGKEVKHA